MHVRAPIAAALAACAVVAAPTAASAFCGFYVSGAGGELFNNATQVVLMREGTRTVLSMANNYQGPAEDFAMVVPVPVVLQESEVKTLPREVFAKVDQLGAPRLVEYWEQDPCGVRGEYDGLAAAGAAMPRRAAASEARHRGDLGVTVEAQFAVGEYKIVILSARDAAGLDTWLRQEGYQIPAGAEPYLRPYVASGSKFFVAKVDVAKVRFDKGQAMLSPLRFHYDADQFVLPIRLGMMNSSGTQDLIVNVLAPDQRYEVANYPAATIPTNLDVVDEARGRFGEFYAALFDRTLAKHPGAIVTEYAWDAGSCDPCPTPALDAGALATLGADVLDLPARTPPAPRARPAREGDAVDQLRASPRATRRRASSPRWRNFVLTRLHMRYPKDGAGDDLVFKAVGPIAGGREWRGDGGRLEEGAQASAINNFQARYAIRHEWTGPISCARPVRGVWGGPPDGGARPVQAATDLAFARRGGFALASAVRHDVPEIGLEARAASDATAAHDAAEPRTAEDAPKYPVRRSNGCAAGGAPSSGVGLGVALAALVAAARRRRAAG